MKKSIRFFSLTVLFIGVLQASQYVVVANKNMPHLTQAQIKAIFLKKMKITHGINIIPLNLSPRDSLRISFEKNILKTNFRRLKSYWTQQHYLGHRPPISMQSQESAIAFLKKVDGAITYIDSEHLNQDMKILLRWNH